MISTRPSRWIVAFLFFGFPATLMAQAPAPAAPTSPQPTNGQTGVASNTTLSWSATDATSFDISFGTPGSVAVVATNQITMSYQPNIVLVGGQTYNWSVTVHNANGQVTGPVWSFTVAANSATNPPKTGADATSFFQNAGFGVALALQWNVVGPPIINDAAVDANGIVRVNTRANTNPGFMLEGHVLPWQNKAKSRGFGPFVAVQPGGNNQVISAVGAGVLLDWKPDPTKRGGFGLGFGYASIPAAKTLGDEFVPNKTAPVGSDSKPLPIRFETRDKGSVLLVLSLTF